MHHHFPIHFTLENGTKVQVNKVADNIYDFLLTELDGKTDNFTYTRDSRSKEEVERSLDFHQLDALRTFWLKRVENT